jgi:hypothetical protein
MLSKLYQIFYSLIFSNKAKNNQVFFHPKRRVFIVPLAVLEFGIFSSLMGMSAEFVFSVGALN